MIEKDMHCKFLTAAMNEDIITILQSLAISQPGLFEVCNEMCC